MKEHPIHVLVVDDDSVMRMLLAMALKALGYRVSMASHPDEALTTAARHDDIRIVITDVVMPGMSGVVLSGMLREIHPALKSLYISGHPRSFLTQLGGPDNSSHFLQKPFHPTDLDSRIQTILAEPALP